jgi:hypothetical protein
MSIRSDIIQFVSENPMLTQQEIIAAFEGMNGLLVSANIGKLLDEGVLYKTVVSKKIFIPQTTIKRSQK